MNKEHTYCVIMAGGVGSRFWPLSRTDHPKQFLDFMGIGRTLLQQTFDRFASLCLPENILVVTNHRYKELVLQQLPGLALDQILLEPDRRNTAPCIAYANQAIRARMRKYEADPDQASIIVAPSDHLVLKENAFHDTVKLALDQTRSEDSLVTLGIMPSRPDTGYGYIQFDPEGQARHPKVKKVRSFTEKPDHDTALTFLESGDFLWNSGIFVWSSGSISKAFSTYLPDMAALFDEIADAIGTEGEAEAVNGIYADCPNVSIDYGIMEKASNVYTVVSDFGWSDLGTWGSLYTQLPKDREQNVVMGEDIRLYDCERNMVRSSKGRLIVLQGLSDHIVIDTPDALLVCSKHEEQKIRQFVNDLKADGEDERI